MKIFRPVKSDYLHQGFGENRPCAKLDANGKPIRPFKIITPVGNTCPVGYTKFYPEIGLKGHNGWDNDLYHGEPIYFPVIVDQPNMRWQVINEVDVDGGIGVNVYGLDPVPFAKLPIHEPGQFKMIQRQYEELGGKLYPMFKFWHCLSTVVKNHDLIQAGDLIAYGDSTGASSGDHLHWCMKIHNGNGFSIDSDNGFTGALDHKPYYENKFIRDILKPQFKFKNTMRKGERNVEVGVMQAVLVRFGYMQPFKARESGIYGPKTQTAVFDFQKKNVQMSAGDLALRGSVAGPKTIAALNKLISA